MPSGNIWFTVTVRHPDGRIVAHEVRARNEASARRAIEESLGRRRRRNEIVEEVYRQTS